MIDPDRDEWIGLDGTGHGHTIYSYRTNDFDGPNLVNSFIKDNPQDFSATLSGSGWSQKTVTGGHGGSGYVPDVSFLWVPPDDSDTYYAHSQTMAEGSMKLSTSTDVENDNVWHGTADGASQKIITYTATDNGDGATANAQYQLTVHDPREVLTHTTDNTVYENPRRASINIIGPCAASGSYEWSSSISIGSDPGGGLGKQISGLLGIDLTLTYTSNLSSTATAGKDIPAGKTSYLEIYDHYIYYNGTAREWDENGFVSEGPFHIREVPSDPLACYAIKIHEPFDDAVTGGNGGGNQGGGT